MESKKIQIDHAPIDILSRSGWFEKCFNSEALDNLRHRLGKRFCDWMRTHFSRFRHKAANHTPSTLADQVEISRLRRI